MLEVKGGADVLDAPTVAPRPKLVKTKPDARPVPLSKIITEGVITITPELALRITQQCGYERQRPIRPAHVNVLASQMRRREWTSGTQIHFARLPDGMLVLLNGNHRIHAVVRSDTTVRFQVLVTDAPNMDGLKTLYRRHDRMQAGRTIADALAAEGLVEKHGLQVRMAQAVFKAMPVIHNNFQGARKADPYILRSDEHRLRMADDWWATAQLYQDAIVKAPEIIKKHLAGGAVTAVALVTLRYQEAKADAFWRGIANNDGLRDGDPRRAYISHLITPRPRSDKQAAKAAALAWNAFFRDRPLNTVRVQAGPTTILGTSFARAPKS